VTCNDEHLTFYDQISPLSKSCYSHINELRCVRPYLDSKTAKLLLLSTLNLTTVTLSTTIFLSLKQIASSRFRTVLHIGPTVVKASKSSHITPIIGSLHWLKIDERIKYKLLSLTYKVLTTNQPDYLYTQSYFCLVYM